MKISAKSEYGVLALLFIACNGEERPVTVQTMAQELHIPRRFLEQIVGSFKRSGFIKSIRGARGGYVLAKAPENITLADVLNVTEGRFQTWPCVTEKENFYCSMENICALHHVWQDVQVSVDDIFKSFNIKQMRDKTRDLKRRQAMLTQAWSEVH